MNTTIERLRSEMDKVNQKYVNMRKSAIALKEQVDNRTQFLHQRHSEFAETMRKIKKYLDESDFEKLSTIVKNSLIVHSIAPRNEVSVNGFEIGN